MCARYTDHVMIVLQQFYNFINIQYPVFVTRRMVYIWKRSYRKKKEGRFEKNRD